jgi:hypothetical protein
MNSQEPTLHLKGAPLSPETKLVRRGKEKPSSLSARSICDEGKKSFITLTHHFQQLLTFDPTWVEVCQTSYEKLKKQFFTKHFNSHFIFFLI